jgi:hypothetical protein
MLRLRHETDAAHFMFISTVIIKDVRRNNISRAPQMAVPQESDSALLFDHESDLAQN